MSGPYRVGTPAPAATPLRRRLDEDEQPPLRAIGVRAFSDGTTALRFRKRRSLLVLGFCWIWGSCMLLLSALFTDWLVTGEIQQRDDDTGTLIVLLGMGILCLGFAIGHWLGGERIVMTPAGLVRRRGRLGRADVAALDDVSTVVVTGNEPSLRVDVQLGRRRLEILDDLGYSETQLRWCVQRLRRALDAARAARS